MRFLLTKRKVGAGLVIQLLREILGYKCHSQTTIPSNTRKQVIFEILHLFTANLVCTPKHEKILEQETEP